MIEKVLWGVLGGSILVMEGSRFYQRRLMMELVRLIQVGPGHSSRKRLSKQESSGFGSITIHPLFRWAVASSRISKDLTESDLKQLRSDPEYADLLYRYSRVASVDALSLLAFIASIFVLVLCEKLK